MMLKSLPRSWRPFVVLLLPTLLVAALAYGPALQREVRDESTPPRAVAESVKKVVQNDETRVAHSAPRRSRPESGGNNAVILEELRGGILDCTALVAPDKLVSIESGPTSVHLRWRDLSNCEEGFRVYRHTSKESFEQNALELIVLGSLPGKPRWGNYTNTMSRPTPGTRYCYKVTSFKDNGSRPSQITCEPKPVREELKVLTQARGAPRPVQTGSVGASQPHKLGSSL